LSATSVMTDGSGKATQTNLLVDRLRQSGYQVEVADFPRYGKKSAALVEDYLNGKFGSPKEVGPYRASIFYAIDRYDASFEIKKWLEQGKIVICNRYVSANMGHQAGKIENKEERDKFLNWLEDLEFNIFNIPKPDVVIFLYVPPEIVGTEMEKEYNTAMESAKKAYEQISQELPEEAQYIVPMAYNIHWYFQINLRSLQWLTELRSQPAGHPTYRLIAQEMARQVSLALPQFERFFKFVDYEGYELGRLGAEVRQEEKIKTRS